MTDSSEPKLRPTPAESGRLAEQPPVNPTEVEKTEIVREQGAETASEQTKIDTKQSFADRISLRRKPKQITIPQVRDEVTVKIEKIMEDGVGDAFARLSPIQKQEFKLKGEAVARAVGDMVRTGHLKAKKILRLILEWLKMLPGVNRFFLEQEAKIKTDRIISLVKEKRM